MRAGQRNVAQRERDRVRERERGMSLSKALQRRRSVQRPLQIFCLVFIYMAPGNFLFLPLFFFLLFKKYYPFYYLWCEIYGVKIKLMVPVYFWHQLKGHFLGVRHMHIPSKLQAKLDQEKT